MGLFSDFFKVQPQKLRTDGIYLWKFSGQTINGFCPGLSVLLLFVGDKVYMEDFGELYNPSNQDLREIIKIDYYEDLKSGTIKRDKDRIEVEFIGNAYKGLILENKLVLDIFHVFYDIKTTSIVEKKIYSKAEFNFYKI